MKNRERGEMNYEVARNKLAVCQAECDKNKISIRQLTWG